MDASFIASPPTNDYLMIENYDRVSTLQQAETYFSEPLKPPSSKLDAACSYVFEQHQRLDSMNLVEKACLWKVKLIMERNYPSYFKRLFPSKEQLDPPEEFERKPDLKPELKPSPKLPPYPKKEAVELFEAELKARELKFQTEVMTLFLNDYGESLFSNPIVKFLWQYHLCTDQQPTIEAIMQIIGFPKPSDFQPDQKSFLLATVKGIERFFAFYSMAAEGEDPVDKIAAQRADNHLNELYTSSMSDNLVLIRTSEIFNELLISLLKDKIPHPYLPLLTMTLSMKMTEIVLSALEPANLFLFINHVSEIKLDEITHDPNPPLEDFKADDLDFSKTAGNIIHELIKHLIKMIPVNSVERKIIKRLEKWLDTHSHELGETIQLAVLRLLKSPGRLKITQGIFHLLWSVKEGKTSPVFPNVQKGEELSRAPEILEAKFVRFAHASLGWKIDHATSQRNLGIRLLTKVSTKISDGFIKSNLKKGGRLIFNLLTNKRLLLSMLGFIFEEIRLSKKE